MGNFFGSTGRGGGGDPALDLENYKIELDRRLRHALSHIDVTAGITGLSANRLVSSNSIGGLESVSNLTNWIAGTPFQIIVTSDGDGTITLSTPQNLHTGATPDFAGGRFGNVAGGHYSEFESDGTIKFNGDATVFVDLLGPLIGERLESPSSDVITNGAEGSITYKTSATIADYVIQNYQINHFWKLGSDIKPHLHWWQTSTNMPNWLIQYRWQKQGEAKTTSWTSVKYTTNAFTYSSGTLNQITTFGAITPPVGYSLSDIVQIRLIRDTTNASTLFAGADGLASSVDAVQFDIHVECDTTGSRQEYSK